MVSMLILLAAAKIVKQFMSFIWTSMPRVPRIYHATYWSRRHNGLVVVDLICVKKPAKGDSMRKQMGQGENGKREIQSVE